MDVIRGKVWKFGNNINTDVIIPAKYAYNIKDLITISAWIKTNNKKPIKITNDTITST